jgi:hypothetical protein
MTAPPINLNRARKIKARAEAAAMAMENRAKFGRTKAQKQADASDAAKAVRDLNGHKRER